MLISHHVDGYHMGSIMNGVGNGSNMLAWMSINWDDK